MSTVKGKKVILARYILHGLVCYEEYSTESYALESVEKYLLANEDISEIELFRCDRLNFWKFDGEN